MHILFDILRSQQADDPYAFQLGRQVYIARTAGGGAATAVLDWDAALLADLAALRRPRPDAAVAQRLGDRLRRFLSALGFDDQMALLARAATAGERVTITMRLCAAELYALPWELFTLRATGQYVGALPQVLFRYCWPESAAAPASQISRSENGRILFAWSAAGGAVPAAEHQSAIEQAAALGYHPFSRDKDVISHASVERLRAALTPRPGEGEPPVSVLHLLCHGISVGSTVSLAWDSDGGGSGDDAVDGNRLRLLLAPFASHLRLIVLCACNSGDMGELGNHLGSLAQALHRAGVASVIASRFPLPVLSSCILAETFFRTLLEQPASLETAFLAARQRLAEQQPGLDWACLQLYARPEDGEDTRPVVIRPYRGLSAFQPQDRRFFFGRESEVQEAISDLEALRRAGKPRLLVVAGASGTGKSSVILGGVLPALTQARSAELLPDHSRTKVAALVAELRQARPSALLSDALDALTRALSAGMAGSGTWEYAVMRPGAEPLAALTTALCLRRDESRPFLLIVDQLEEIFTHTAAPAVRESFMQKLWALAQGDTGLSCIATLRVDYLGPCGDITLDELGLRLDRVAYDEAHRVFVAQMGAEALRTAIEGPARLVGLELEAGLAAQMIAEVKDEPGALPLLEYVLELLWQRREGRHLTVRAYVELGGVVGALEGKAERVYARLSSSAQRLAHRLLVRLASHGDLALGDSRRRAPLKELRTQVVGSESDFGAVVAAFVDARLLVRSEDGGQILLEVAHEALLRKWQRLRTWLDDDRQMLAEIRELDRWAEQYTTYGTLLNGAQLGFAQQVLERHAQDVGTRITSMVQDSLAAQRRRRQQLGTVLLTILLILSGFSLYAYRSKQQAEHERQLARNEANTAASRLLTVQAARVRDSNPAEALLLSAHAMWLKDDRDSRDTMAAALTFSSGVRTFLRGPQGNIRGLAFSADSEQLAASDRDGSVWIFEVRTGIARRHLRGASRMGLQSLAFSPDGRWLAAAGQGSQVWLWDLTGEAPPETLLSTARLVSEIEFSADGALLAAAGDRGRALVWNLGSRRMSELQVAAVERVISTLHFIPGGGNKLAAGLDDGAVLLFDIDTQTVLKELRGERSGVVEALAVSPNGRWLVSGGSDEAADRWQLDAQAPIRTPLPQLRRVADLFFQPASHFMGACTTDGALLVTDMASEKPGATPLPFHVGPVARCVQSGDGRLLALGVRDAVVLWDLTTHPVLHQSYHPHAATALAASPDGKSLAIGSPDGSVRFVDMSSQRTLGAPVVLHRGSVNGLVYREGGHQVISVGSDGAVMRIDTDQPAPNLPVPIARPALGAIMSVAYSAQSDRLAACTANGWLLLFNLKPQPSRELLRRRVVLKTGEPVSLFEVRFSPDGSTLGAVGTGGSVTLWDTGTLGQRGEALSGYKATTDVRSLDFSPDGRTLASAGGDKLVRLFNLTTDPPGPDEPPLQHSQAVVGVRFGPDGQLLAAATADHRIVLWSPKSHQPFGLPLVGHTRSISALVFPSNGLLVSGDGETIWHWDVALSEGRQRACARANYNLSQAVWEHYFPGRPYCRLCAGIPAGAGADAAAGDCLP